MSAEPNARWIARLRGLVLLLLLAGSALVCSTARVTSTAHVPQKARGVTQIVCTGLACGGNGGIGIPCSGSQFCYRVQPNGNSITVLEVGVEDGTPAHYTSFCGPAGWGMTIVSLPRSHDVDPSDHGALTGEEGSCPYVLRFSGPTQDSAFEVGYSYLGNPATTRFHDTSWNTSDGRQAAWGFPLGTNNGPVHSPVPLNVLVIVLDDVGCDKLSLYDGNQAPPYAPTPRLDQLAANGIRFTNCYAPPLCSPSRACIQTGRYAMSTGMSYQSEEYELPSDEVLLAELLRHGFPGSLGYRSGVFGKWHLGRVNPGHPVENGYDRFYGTLANTLVYDGVIVGDHFKWAKIEHDAGSPPPTGAIPMTTWVAEATRTDAVGWINAQSAPFFAYVCFNPPHVPEQVPPSQTQDGRPLLGSSTLAALDWSGNQPCDGNGALPGDMRDPDCPDQYKLFYRAALEAVDAEIGYLIDDLASVKKENTMILVVGDNGTPRLAINPPHDSLNGKGTLYQHGVHVPLIVSGPFSPSGSSVCVQPVSVVDLWRTIAEITGANEVLAFQNLNLPPHEINSVSFFPLIVNPTGTGAASWAFCQMFEGVGPYTSVNDLSRHKRCITNGQFKYIRTISDHTPGVPISFSDYTHEFYDVIADPEEATNLWTPTLQDPVYLLLSSEMDALSEF